MARHSELAALLLPLLLLVVVGHLPASAPAAADNPLASLFNKTNDAVASSSSAMSSYRPSVPASTVVDDKSKDSSSSSSATSSSEEDDKEEDDDDEKEKEKEEKEKEEKEKEKDKEKKREREKQMEKEIELEKEMMKEAMKKGLVPSVKGKGSYKGMPREFVDGHNKVRARYGVPPVKWDKKLAKEARRWSYAMRKDCVLKHSTTKYGESVFTSKETWNATAADALYMWGREEPFYDKRTGKCLDGRSFTACGHFALMVLEKNKKIGCARAECYKGGVFITCNYFHD